MKIAMITFHNVMNLGANLQAYALNKYINSNIGACEIIDFYPNNQTAHKHWWRKILSNIKSFIFFRKYSLRRKYQSFQKKFYVLSSETFYGDAQLYRHPPKYDIIISGSDQILNTTLSDISQSYYLGFDNRAKKISYASSFGRTVLSDSEYSLIDVELKKFMHLSAREESAKKIIEQRIGAEVELVLDPVFLLSADEWETICEKIKPSDDYILVYAMEVTNSLVDAVNKVRDEYSLPIFVIYGCSDNRVIKGNIIKDCGPLEFISYVRQAKFVVTNSFHGTAFSIIFKKKFVCVSHSCRNTRLENITGIIGEREKLMGCSLINNSITDYVVDGAAALSRLTSYIERSKRYLCNACQEQTER